jgi:cytochrome bd-type quinol oxidase subunit 2
MIITLATIIPIFFLFLYITLFPLEIGAILQRWKPQRFGNSFSVTPVWELTGVFLVFALVSFMAFFPGALTIYGPLLVLPMFIFLTFQAIRIILFMLLFYRPESPSILLPILFVITLLTPAVLVGSALPLLVFGAAWTTLHGLITAGFVAIAVMAISMIIAIVFLQYYEKQPGGRVRFWLLIACLVCVWIILSLRLLPNNARMAYLLTDTHTAAMLLWVCLIGTCLIVPGIALLYNIFL